jgi:hypothetical protein
MLLFQLVLDNTLFRYREVEQGYSHPMLLARFLNTNSEGKSI